MKNQFSISELEQFSGIKAHTFRTWEFRYGLLIPQRTNSNLRFYTLDDVKQLLNISLLNKAGMRISKIASLSTSAIEQKLKDLKDPEIKKQNEVYKLVISMFSSDIEELEMILDNCILSWGIDDTLHDIIIPFLVQVNLLSYNDSSTDIHFVVTAIRRKIILGIEKANPHKSSEKTAMLFLPKNEHYDLILLYLDYKLKLQGIKTLYLGTNISLENLKKVATEKQPGFLISYLSPKNEFKYQDYIPFLEQRFAGRTYLVAPFTPKFAKADLSATTTILQYKRIDEFTGVE